MVSNRHPRKIRNSTKRVEIKLIKNNNTNTTIAKKYSICSNIDSQMRGLMFSKKKNLIFIFPKEKRISLHMLFVFFPIWVVYLDKNKKTVDIRKLYPFISFIYPKQKAKYVLELTEKPKIKIGDIMRW